MLAKVTQSWGVFNDARTIHSSGNKKLLKTRTKVGRRTRSIRRQPTFRSKGQKGVLQKLHFKDNQRLVNIYKKLFVVSGSVLSIFAFYNDFQSDVQVLLLVLSVGDYRCVLVAVFMFTFMFMQYYLAVRSIVSFFKAGSENYLTRMFGKRLCSVLFRINSVEDNDKRKFQIGDKVRINLNQEALCSNKSPANGWPTNDITQDQIMQLMANTESSIGVIAGLHENEFIVDFDILKIKGWRATVQEIKRVADLDSSQNKNNTILWGGWIVCLLVVPFLDMFMFLIEPIKILKEFKAWFTGSNDDDDSEYLEQNVVTCDETTGFMLQYTSVREITEILLETLPSLCIQIILVYIIKIEDLVDSTVENEEIEIFGVMTTTLIYSFVSTSIHMLVLFVNALLQASYLGLSIRQYVVAIVNMGFGKLPIQAIMNNKCTELHLPGFLHPVQGRLLSRALTQNEKAKPEPSVTKIDGWENIEQESIMAGFIDGTQQKTTPHRAFKEQYNEILEWAIKNSYSNLTAEIIAQNRKNVKCVDFTEVDHLDDNMIKSIVWGLEEVVESREREQYLENIKLQWDQLEEKDILLFFRRNLDTADTENIAKTKKKTCCRHWLAYLTCNNRKRVTKVQPGGANRYEQCDIHKCISDTETIKRIFETAGDKNYSKVVEDILSVFPKKINKILWDKKPVDANTVFAIAKGLNSSSSIDEIELPWDSLITDVNGVQALVELIKKVGKDTTRDLQKCFESKYKKLLEIISATKSKTDVSVLVEAILCENPPTVRKLDWEAHIPGRSAVKGVTKALDLKCEYGTNKSLDTLRLNWVDRESQELLSLVMTQHKSVVNAYEDIMHVAVCKSFDSHWNKDLLYPRIIEEILKQDIDKIKQLDFTEPKNKAIRASNSWAQSGKAMQGKKQFGRVLAAIAKGIIVEEKETKNLERLLLDWKDIIRTKSDAALLELLETNHRCLIPSYSIILRKAAEFSCVKIINHILRNKNSVKLNIFWSDMNFSDAVMKCLANGLIDNKLILAVKLRWVGIREELLLRFVNSNHIAIREQSLHILDAGVSKNYATLVQTLLLKNLQEIQELRWAKYSLSKQMLNVLQKPLTDGRNKILQILELDWSNPFYTQQDILKLIHTGHESILNQRVSILNAAGKRSFTDIVREIISQIESMSSEDGQNLLQKIEFPDMTPKVLVVFLEERFYSLFRPYYNTIATVCLQNNYCSIFQDLLEDNRKEIVGIKLGVTNDMFFLKFEVSSDGIPDAANHGILDDLRTNGFVCKSIREIKITDQPLKVLYEVKVNGNQRKQLNDIFFAHSDPLNNEQLSAIGYSYLSHEMAKALADGLAKYDNDPAAKLDEHAQKSYIERIEIDWAKLQEDQIFELITKPNDDITGEALYRYKAIKSSIKEIERVAELKQYRRILIMLNPKLAPSTFETNFMAEHKMLMVLRINNEIRGYTPTEILRKMWDRAIAKEFFSVVCKILETEDPNLRELEYLGTDRECLRAIIDGLEHNTTLEKLSLSWEKLETGMLCDFMLTNHKIGKEFYMNNNDFQSTLNDRLERTYQIWKMTNSLSVSMDNISSSFTHLVLNTTLADDSKSIADQVRFENIKWDRDELSLVLAFSGQCKFLTQKIHHVKINQPVYNDMTLLHIALKKGKHEIVRLLLKHEDIDPNKCVGGMSPLYIAAKGYPKAFDERRFSMDSSVRDINQVVSGIAPNTKAVEELLRCKSLYVRERGSKLSSKSRSPLRVSAENGYIDIVKLLLRRSSDYNFLNDGNPLHGACQNGHTDVVRLLLEEEFVEVNGSSKPTDNYKYNPLWAALQSCYTDIITGLIDDSRVEITPALVDFANKRLKSLQSKLAHSKKTMLFKDTESNSPEGEFKRFNNVVQRINSIGEREGMYIGIEEGSSMLPRWPKWHRAHAPGIVSMETL